MSDSFIMLSLDDEETSNVTSILTNDTAKKILNHLTTKEYSTASDISEELDIPISTVHYNVEKLRDSDLIVSDEYHYSEKGREVKHYKLANKHIIISPKKDETFLSKLKNVLPGFIIVGAFSLTIYVLEFFTQPTQTGRMQAESAMMGKEDVATGSADPTTLLEGIPYSVYLFLGGVIALLIHAVYDHYK